MRESAWCNLTYLFLWEKYHSDPLAGNLTPFHFRRLSRAALPIQLGMNRTNGHRITPKPVLWNRIPRCVRKCKTCVRRENGCWRQYSSALRKSTKTKATCKVFIEERRKTLYHKTRGPFRRKTKEIAERKVFSRKILCF